MAKPFKLLKDRMSPESRERAAAKAKRLMADMPLNELRAARRLTQEQLAAKLHVKQASVSKLERRADLYISTLRGYVEAMGGELEIVARFPDGDVRIDQFTEDATTS
jgi:hypothetical protein